MPLIGPTWDCGLKGLTPAMEYTATGFSKPIRMIFKALFRPRREVQREYDYSPYFAKTLRFESHIEEAFVSRLYRPRPGLTPLLLVIAAGLVALIAVVWTTPALRDVADLLWLKLQLLLGA